MAKKTFPSKIVVEPITSSKKVAKVVVESASSKKVAKVTVESTDKKKTTNTKLVEPISTKKSKKSKKKQKEVKNTIIHNKLSFKPIANDKNIQSYFGRDNKQSIPPKPFTPTIKIIQSNDSSV